MRPVTADFLTLRRLPGWVYKSLIGGLVLLSAYLANSAWDAAAQRRALDAQVERARAELVRLESERITADQPKPRAYSGDAAAIAALAGFRTDAVLANIESARLEGVRVTSLNIDVASSTVTLEISARDQALVLKYLAALNSGVTPAAWKFVRAQFVGQNGQAVSASLVALVDLGQAEGR